MFERFTTQARSAVVQAQDEARRLGSANVGTEHVLLGILGDPTCAGARVLTGLGLELEPLRDDVARADRADRAPAAGDEEALRTLGIDLDQVRRAAEETFGPGALERPRVGRRGHIPFTPRSKRALEAALREALRLGHRYIGTEHLLLGLVRVGGSIATRIVRGRGVTVEQVRDAVAQEVAQGGDRPGRTA